MVSQSSGPNHLRVLIVDGEQSVRSCLRLCLKASGCSTTVLTEPEQALEVLKHQHFDLAFLDLEPDAQGERRLLPRFLEACPDLRVVLTAGVAPGPLETLVREGAVDYLPKPFTPGQCLFLMDRISRDLERRAGSGEYLGRAGPPDALLSSVSPTMKRVIAEVQQLGPHEVPVLLLGENGTGKGVLAHVVHALSPRRARPFEVVRCACSSRESLAVELFGHAEGGTSGALRSSEGRIEAANGGTLFFDEVAELPANLQAWLVRFLESKTFERLGESHSRSANVRVLAASAHDLETEVKAGRFRQDLYYRLGGVDVSIPPLRERREDILPLASWFLAHFAEADRRVAPSLSAGVQKQLLAYSWPGNVRELRNSMEQAAIFSLGREEIGVDDLPYRLLSQEGAGVFLGGDFTLEQVKQEHIQRVMARAATLSEASQTLGINASTLWRRRKHSGGAD